MTTSVLTFLAESHSNSAFEWPSDAPHRDATLAGEYLVDGLVPVGRKSEPAPEFIDGGEQIERRARTAALGKALQRAIRMVKVDPAQRRWIVEKIRDDGWEDAALSAAYHCQVETLHRVGG